MRDCDCDECAAEIEEQRFWAEIEQRGEGVEL